MKNSFKFGFSLVEVMISLLILLIITVALAPLITKKTFIGKNEGVVYTFRKDNLTQDTDKCYISSSEDVTTSRITSSNCSEYIFTVPDGITSINLTLVAGGGGGGGAAGGTIEEFEEQHEELYDNIKVTTDYIVFDKLKSVKIDYLTATGETGGEADKTCSVENVVACGGKGGFSAPMLVNYPIPYDMMRGYGFVNELDEKNAPKGTFIFGSDSCDNYSIKIANELNPDLGPIYNAVYYNEENTYCNYTGDNTKYMNYTYNNVEYPIPDGYVVPPAEGLYGVYALSSDNVESNTVLSGGQGGRISSAGLHGQGGTGQTCVVSKNGSNITCSKIPVNLQKGRPAGARLSYAIEHPGGTGGGGAAGTFARIIGFPVIPGDTYIIYVGGGGEGGAAGTSSLSPAEGSKGSGGISTAIYDSSDKLIFMVTGGVGGEGGNVYSSNGGSYTGDIGKSGRGYAEIFYTDEKNLNIDASKMMLGSNSTSLNGHSGKNLIYPLFEENENGGNEPYYSMNLNGESNSDEKYGGFSAFEKGLKYENVTLPELNSSHTVYNGLYYRTLIGNDGNEAAYIGGLGGFNGLGGKAGCGGYFLGNFDGRVNSDTITYNALKPAYKFIQDLTLYSAFTYYDNCSAENSNGHAAAFVKPDPVSLSYGQAGAGGGGGGWNMQNGAGKGGDGQDGYLMIDWRK